MVNRRLLMDTNDNIKTSVKDCVLHNFYFKFFSLIAVGLIVTSFFIPPVAIIDSSVFIGVGEIFAFAALGTVVKAIDKGVDAKVEHNGTSLTVGDLNKDKDNGNEEYYSDRDED